MWVLAAAMLVPAALWYVYAAGAIAVGGGSRASADNGGIWFGVLVPRALLSPETYRHVGRFLLVRAFTPLGPPLALAGLLWTRPRADRLWLVWGGSALVAMALLAAKLHHEYYWLSIAPVASVGAARGLAALSRHGLRGRAAAGALGIGLAGLSGLFAASTWRTPGEWSSLREAAREVQGHVPPGALVVAPEALLFEADRKGCRLELTRRAARRASGEWGGALDDPGLLDLVEFYRARGAGYFADVVPDEPGGERLALHEAVRRRYNVVVDRPGVLIARLEVHNSEGLPAWPATPRPNPRPTGR
jgi:hypothetical protein